ncbi:MAG TPA: phosphate-starvation-inducible PsiE family protein [Chloroflexota bacterium]|nr:phosphate-starvation-inducible PsiE family protein [Chloroflexota bacterium]
MEWTARHQRIERRLEAGGQAWGRWLDIGENLVLLGVGTVLLLAGLLVVLVAGQELLHALAFRTFSEDIIDIAETALLGLILAELVHTVLLPLRGQALTPEPFLVITVVALARDMLLTSVLIPQTLGVGPLITGPMVAISVQGLVALVLVGALVLLRWYRAR